MPAPARYVDLPDEREFSDAYSVFAAPRDRAVTVQLVRPFAVHSRNTYSAPVTPPIGMAYLGAVLEKAGYSVSVLDGLGDAINHLERSDCGRFQIQGLPQDDLVARIDPACDVIGISLMFSQEWFLHRLFVDAVRNRNPDAVIVLGGEHPTAMPEFILESCTAVDAVVAGEGEMTMLELVHRVAAGGDLGQIPGVFTRAPDGSIVANGLSRRIKHLDDIPRPAWHLLNLDNFAIDNWTMGISKGRNLPIVATRGCPYQCTFCSNPTMWTTRYLMRDPKDVVDEIEFLHSEYGATSIDFFDLTAIVKREWTLDFCSELERRGLAISWQLPSGTRSEALDEETLSAMKRTGCDFVVYAPESGSAETLRLIKKKVKLDRITESIRTATRAGLVVKVNLIIGFPEERWRNVLATYWFAVRLALFGAADVNISTFCPYPGSEIYRDLRECGELPPPSDDYFRNLAVQFDFTSEFSVCRHVSGRALSLVRFFGHSTFYVLAYLTHPRRLARLASSAFSEKFQPYNLFEQRVHDFIVRRRLIKADAKSRADGGMA